MYHYTCHKKQKERKKNGKNKLVEIVYGEFTIYERELPDRTLIINISAHVRHEKVPVKRCAMIQCLTDIFFSRDAFVYDDFLVMIFCALHARSVFIIIGGSVQTSSHHSSCFFARLKVIKREKKNRKKTHDDELFLHNLPRSAEWTNYM